MAHKASDHDVDALFREIRASDPASGDPWKFRDLQNETMLRYFHGEQFEDASPAGVHGRSKRLIERDFGGLETFWSVLLSLAADQRADWVIWGLCFADFRFRLFPVGPGPGGVPFCVSPMLVVDLRVARAQGEMEAVSAFIRTLNWAVIENRVSCLEMPLDIFAPPKDCQEDVCG